jgi:hypothetical protein
LADASLAPAAFPILGGAMALVVVAPPALAGAHLADRGDTVPGAPLGAVAIYPVCFVSAFDAADLEHVVRVKRRPAVA